MVTQPINTPSPFETSAASTASKRKMASSTSTDSSTDSSTSTSGSSSAPTEQMFLQLLVAQIQNQDPTSPSDPSQFVSQLAQFSELEQVLAIRQDTDTLSASAKTAATATATA
jgi:flagellar basal-body rod modification protein FlgD